MRRLFWVSVGVGATVYVLRKVSKVNAVATHLTPGGMAAAVNNLADSLRTASAELKPPWRNTKRLTEALLGTYRDRRSRRVGTGSGTVLLNPESVTPRVAFEKKDEFMRSAEIRRRWLEFFSERGHTVVPSAPLISPDPSTLFTIAGMVQFIPYMLGEEPAPWPRATSVQKCVRTADIEEVGKTTRHGTFFQMNGNFSFGDYFKEGAIRYAWEFITGSEEDGGLGFSPDDVWVTVFETDDDAARLWKDIAGLPDERIQRRGMEDNYWSTGARGPAGPCSEIYIDRGPEYGEPGGPVVDEDRFLEIWNLVFMEFERDDGGTKDDFPILGEPNRRTSIRDGPERSRCSSRAWTTCTRSTRSTPSSPPPSACLGRSTAPMRTTMCGCACSPTTSARR